MTGGAERGRKLVVCNILSLDGSYDGPGEDVMVMPLDEGFDTYNLERLQAASTLVLGRTSYTDFMGFWPPQAHDPEASAQAQKIGAIFPVIDKVVVSDSIGDDVTGPWSGSTTVVGRAGATAAVRDLKSRDGDEILVFASRRVWHGLLADGLVDEIHLFLGPGVVPSGGTRLMPDAVPDLELLGTRTFDGSSAVVLRYRVDG